MEIKVPAAGESVTEATISEWAKKDGDIVNRDDVLLTLETDKASLDVVAEVAGQLKIKAKAGDVVKVGAIIGEIDESKAGQAGAAKTNGASKASPPPPAAGGPTPAAPAMQVQPRANPGPTPSPSSQMPMSPAVRRIVAENQMDPNNIPGTGKGGRITKGDALQSMKAPAAPTPSAPAKPVARIHGDYAERTVREPMTTIRKKIAERLVEAQHTAAILTTFNEIDMGPVMALRAKYKEKFEKKYGIGLGFMGFYVKAVIEALKAFPKVNAFIDGTDVVYHNYYNIGIAVGTDRGLMVPVLKDAQDMNLAEIEMTIRDFATRAREGKISIDDLNGGTFTISNGGVYGSLMSTPILNPPQSGILGMHKIEERPVAVNGQVVIKPMMYVALSYDHRIIDGGESVSFLVRVKDCIEDPSRILLEI